MPVPVVAVGPLAYDDVRTPSGHRAGVLGGSAAYASVAAAKYGPVALVSVAGRDLADADVQSLTAAGVDVRGIERRDGRTLRWSGAYAPGFARSDVQNTDLGVVREWRPRVPNDLRDADHVFLANTDPRAQLEALDQLHPAIALLDTMDEWIRQANGLDAVIARATVLAVNALELALITGVDDPARGAAAVLGRGPRAVIVKRGALGALLITTEAIVSVPAYPATVVDPTGAGDAFAGAFLGRVAEQDRTDDAAFLDAFAQGAAAASVAIESFGVEALVTAGRAELDRRAAWLGSRAGTGQTAPLYEGR